MTKAPAREPRPHNYVSQAPAPRPLCGPRSPQETGMLSAHKQGAGQLRGGGAEEGAARPAERGRHVLSQPAQGFLVPALHRHPIRSLAPRSHFTERKERHAEVKEPAPSQAGEQQLRLEPPPSTQNPAPTSTAWGTAGSPRTHVGSSLPMGLHLVACGGRSRHWPDARS